MLSLMLMKQKIAKLELAFGMLSRAFVAAAAVSLLAAPSFVQAQTAPDNRVFVELNRGTGAAGAFVEATVYIDRANPEPGVTEGGFNAIGASLSWMNGDFTWNVNEGGTPITESANLMAGEDLMAAPGAMPNFELLQEVDPAGIGVFFETDETSSAITVTIVQTAFANVDEQILPCTFFEPPNIPPEGVANCNAFPIFRATLQVGDSGGTTAAVMAVASARAQSPAPAADFTEMDIEPFERQIEPSILTVTSALSPVTLDTASTDPQEIGTLTVARNAVSDGLQARLGNVVWTISTTSSDNADSLNNLLSSLTLAVDVTIGTTTVFTDVTANMTGGFGPITTADGRDSAEVTFGFPFDAQNDAQNITDENAAVLTLNVSLSLDSSLADGTEYTLSLTSVGVVGEDGMSESAPGVGPLPAATAALRSQVIATELRWVDTNLPDLDLGTIQAGAERTLELRATDQFGNLDLDFVGGATLTLSLGAGTLDSNPATFERGAATFSWSYWPTVDMESFDLTASASGLSDAEAMEGVSDAVADMLNFAATVTVQGDPVLEANLVAGAINILTGSLMAQDCMDAAGTVQSCVTDMGVAASSVDLSVTYTFSSTQITNIGNSTVAATVAANMPLSEQVSFASGVAVLAERVFTDPELAENVEAAAVALTFSVDLTGLGMIMGVDTLTMIPGGPDINLDVTMNGTFNTADAAAIFRRVSLGNFLAVDALAVVGQRGPDVTPQQVADAIDALVANQADLLDVTMNDTFNTADAAAIFRRVSLGNFLAVDALAVVGQRGPDVTPQQVAEAIDELVNLTNTELATSEPATN